MKSKNGFDWLILMDARSGEIVPSFGWIAISPLAAALVFAFTKLMTVAFF
jgi:uncharacterized protein YggT (Ycf19 family)